MVFIGIDTHKSSLAVCIVDELGRQLAVESFANDPRGHRRLHAWVSRAGAGASGGSGSRAAAGSDTASRSSCSSRARTSAMCAAT